MAGRGGARVCADRTEAAGGGGGGVDRSAGGRGTGVTMHDADSRLPQTGCSYEPGRRDAASTHADG